MSTLETAQKMLKAAGVRPSTIRVHLLAYLLSHPIHPSVEQIHQALQPEIVTLSKTTIYNTMDLLTTARLVRQITIDGKETHFDAETADHGHFQCICCKQISDFQVNLDEIELHNLTGYHIAEKNLILTGICSECQI